MEKQLESINKTDYSDRIIHIDATGSLVSVSEKHDKYKGLDYKRILNYFILMKVSNSYEIITKIYFF